jgi:hypothetical protein
MEFFTHPYFMIAGGAAVSVPILIHLINRMRYKRIRWAAMEFLLKSEKRTRRPLIVKQLILLLLRILLMLWLAGFLVSRFLPIGAGQRGATHVVVIDDSMSMLDRNKDGEAYAAGIKQIAKIVQAANKAPSRQDIQVYLLSEIDQPPFFEGIVSDATAREIETKFAGRGNRPTLRHASPLPGIQRGIDVLAKLSGDAAQGSKNIYLISDFRDSDWTSGIDAEKMTSELLAALTEGYNVNLVDVAGPARTTEGKEVAYSDNLAIIDFRSSARVAIEDSEVDLTAVIFNFGPAEAPGRLMKVFINGEEDHGLAQVVDRFPAGKATEVKLKRRFPRAGKAKTEITEKDGPLDRERKRRLDREYFNVRVTLPKDARDTEGLHVDNVRDLVIEVRKKVPSIVVDGNKPDKAREGTSDLSHLQAFHAASGEYEIEELSLKDLENADLDLYPSIFLLNVGDLDDKVIEKLKNYVDGGGSLCYFMGEEVKPDHYNTKLFKAGIFPVLIGDRPYDPLAAGFGDPELRKKERERLYQIDKTPKILFPKPDHPVVAQLADPNVRSAFRYLQLNVYWQALPRTAWDPDLRATEPLVVLPNSASALDRYRKNAARLANEVLKQVTDLSQKEKEIGKFVDPIDAYNRRLKAALSANELYQLSEVFEEMLTDPGEKDNPNKPSMKELWAHVELKSLAAEIREFREQVLYGDPLLVAKNVGKGRVVAFLTTAGTALRKGVAGEEAVQWNNWGAGQDLISPFYPIFLLDLQRYLVREGQAPNRVLGQEVTFTVDVSRYEPKYTYTFTPQPDVSSEGGGKPDPEKEESTMNRVGNRFEFSLKGPPTHRPGVFNVTLTHVGDAPLEERQEKRAYAYNVDATNESNLKRASTERLLPETLTSVAAREGKGKIDLIKPEVNDGYETLNKKPPDASEWPLLYLLLIIFLVAEQAMAVHLSHHTKAGPAA